MPGPKKAQNDVEGEQRCSNTTLFTFHPVSFDVHFCYSAQRLGETMYAINANGLSFLLFERRFLLKYLHDTIYWIPSFSHLLLIMKYTCLLFIVLVVLRVSAPGSYFSIFKFVFLDVSKLTCTIYCNCLFNIATLRIILKVGFDIPRSS